MPTSSRTSRNDRLFCAFTDFDKTRDARMDVLIAHSVFCEEELIALCYQHDDARFDARKKLCAGKADRLSSRI